MRCRCADINAINSKLSRLVQAESEVSAYRNTASDLNMETNAVTASLNVTISQEFSESPVASMRSMAASFADAIEPVAAKISSKRSELKNELQRITMEDKHYHEEEERLRLEKERSEEESHVSAT